MTNVAARLAELGEAQPERPALVEWVGRERHQVTFGELARDVAALATGLRRRGIAPGDRVLVLLPMSIELYQILLACHHLGAAAVFLDAWSNRSRIELALHQARPRAFIGSLKAQALRLASSAVRRIPVQIPIEERLSWFSIRRLLGPAAPPAAVDGEAPALITLTTGSTGVPRAVTRSHRFLWTQHQVLRRLFAPRDDDVDMPTLPIFVLNNLASGIPTVLPDFDPRRPAEIDPARIDEQIHRERVTTSSGSPEFYLRLCRWYRCRGKKLPLRALFTGGAPVLPPLARLLRETVEGTATVVYGASEADPISSVEVSEMLRALQENPGEPAVSGLCVGRPVPEIELRLLRPWDGPVELKEGEGIRAWEVLPGEAGELVVAGEHVEGAAATEPEAARLVKIEEEGRTWHRTGDACRLDEEGRLWLLGRIRERVRREGKLWWSLPAEIRAVELPGVRHACYLGCRDFELGQRAVLCLEVPREEHPGPRPEEVREALRPIPVDEVHVLEQLPRDPRHASKVDVEALRERMEREQPGRWHRMAGEGGR